MTWTLQAPFSKKTTSNLFVDGDKKQRAEFVFKINDGTTPPTPTPNNAIVDHNGNFILDHNGDYILI